MKTNQSSRASFYEFRKRLNWTVGTVSLVVLGLGLLWYSADLMLLTFLGVLFAIFLRGLSEPLAKKTGWSETLALVAVCLLLLAVSTGAGWLFSQDLVAQLTELGHRLPQGIAKLEETVAQYSFGRYLIEQSSRVDKLLQRPALLSGATGVLSATFGALSSVVVIFFMGLFFAANPRLYINGFLRLVYPKRRGRARQVLEALGEAMRWWLLGKTMSMLAIGLATGFGLWLLDVQLALVLGTFAGLFSFIPFIGPLMSALPAVLLALLSDPQQALYVIGLFVAVQFVEGNLLTPMIERRTVFLPPALTIFCQVLAAVLFGFLGVLLASPLTAVGLILVRMLYVEDVLEGEDL